MSRKRKPDPLGAVSIKAGALDGITLGAAWKEKSEAEKASDFVSGLLEKAQARVERAAGGLRDGPRAMKMKPQGRRAFVLQWMTEKNAWSLERGWRGYVRGDLIEEIMTRFKVSEKTALRDIEGAKEEILKQ